MPIEFFDVVVAHNPDYNCDAPHLCFAMKGGPIQPADC